MRIIINGINGGMGQNILSAAREAGYSVVAGVDINPDARDNGCPVFTSIDACPADADVIIDFSRPQALPSLLAFARAHSIALVVATTGLTDEDRRLMRQAAEEIPIFNSANMSLGVNLQRNLAQTAAIFLGEAFEIEIIEKHHHRKVDAPSGTALLLADAINEVVDQRLEYVFGRHTKTERRKPNELGLHAIRGGTIVGEHEILFIGPDEVIEIKHSATSRQVFAQGALRAAQFLTNDCKPGMYNMNDIVSTHRTVVRLVADEQIALFTLHDIDAVAGVVSVFDALAKAELNIDMISQSAPENGLCTISCSMPREDAAKAQQALAPLLDASKARLEIATDVCKIAVEGPGMQFQAGVAANLFAALRDQDIPVLSVTTSETKIACCIAQDSLAKAAEAVRVLFSL